LFGSLDPFTSFSPTFVVIPCSCGSFFIIPPKYLLFSLTLHHHYNVGVTCSSSRSKNPLLSRLTGAFSFSELFRSLFSHVPSLFSYLWVCKIFPLSLLLGVPPRFGTAITISCFLRCGIVCTRRRISYWSSSSASWAWARFGYTLSARPSRSPFSLWPMHPLSQLLFPNVFFCRSCQPHRLSC